MNETEKIKASVELCNQRDIISAELDEYNEMINDEYMTVGQYKEYYFNNNAPKTLLLILSFILSFSIIYFVVFRILNLLSASETVTALVDTFVLIVGGCLIYSFMKRLYLKSKEKIFVEYADALSEIEKAMPNLIELRDQTRENLKKHEALMSDENVCIIPKKYWDNANFLYALIQDKRATDIVSAINKYEDIMHQMRMESMAAESLAYQEYAAQCSEIAAHNSAIAAENSRRAAINSGIAAYFSIENYLSSDN